MMRRTCDSSGIRVWRGFRSVELLDERARFEEKLGGIFVPQTAQQMTPLGLQAYFSAVLPDRPSVRSVAARERPHIPDEVALVVYPSAGAYHDATEKSVAGRAYGLLHASVFNFSTNVRTTDGELPPSRSGFPRPWETNWRTDTPYVLGGPVSDWWRGDTTLLAARPAEAVPFDAFRPALAALVDGWLDGAREGIDGSILCVCENYLLYWEHRSRPTRVDSLVPGLKRLLETPWIDRHAAVRRVPPAFRIPDCGLKVGTGDFLDVRLEGAT